MIESEAVLAFCSRGFREPRGWSTGMRTQIQVVRHSHVDSYPYQERGCGF